MGPTFNARACSACHNKDGRGLPLEQNQEFSSGFLLRVSEAGTNNFGGPKPVPNYGNQIQERGNLGIPFEAKVSITYETITGANLRMVKPMNFANQFIQLLRNNLGLYSMF